jgi:preprotein translocase subunit SecG
LSKTTAILATAFFINSLVLAYLASHREVKTESVLDSLMTPAVVVPGEISDEVPAPEMKVPAATDAADSETAVPAEQVTPAEEDVPAPAGE